MDMRRTQSGAVIVLLIGLLALGGLLLVGGREQVAAFPRSVPASAAERSCAKAIAKAGQGVFKARLKQCETCAKKQAKDQEPDSTPCSTYDPTGKVAKARLKGESSVARACSDDTIAALGLGGCGTTVASVQACVGATHDASAQGLCGAMRGTNLFTVYQCTSAIRTMFLTTKLLCGTSCMGNVKTSKAPALCTPKAGGIHPLPDSPPLP